MAILAAGIALAVLGAGVPAQGMRAPLWTGAARMLVRCTADPAVAPVLGPDWCALVIDEARRGAGMPLVAQADGRADRSTLILDVAAGADALTVGVTRALAIDEAEGGMLRRWPALPAASAGDPRVRAALARALDGVLPWRRSARSPNRGWRAS